MMERYDVVIVGGGAAGLMAAAILAQEGGGSLRVAVAEQANRLGKKLLATGNGRCNLYNEGISPEHYFSQQRQALAAGVESVIAVEQLSLWRQLGLLTQADQEGRVYPVCYQAAAVLEVLRTVAEAGGVTFLCDTKVTGLEKKKFFRLTCGDGQVLTARRVILATGGKAAPNLGGIGGGYALAQAAGHTVTPLTPGLVPVRCVNPSRSLKGVRSGCTVSLYQGDHLVERRDGEVQFTDYGVSGIVVMQLSNYMTGKNQRLELDLFPQMTQEALTQALVQKAKNHPGQRGEFLLVGILKTQMGELILRSCRVDGKKRRLGSLTLEELSAIAHRIKHWSMAVEGTLGWEQAQVTLGGVALNEVEQDTFQSKRMPGLYLVGELLDAAGDCGGFNLAWAFGTGILAARGVRAEMEREVEKYSGEK